MKIGIQIEQMTSKYEIIIDEENVFNFTIILETSPVVAKYTVLDHLNHIRNYEDFGWIGPFHKWAKRLGRPSRKQTRNQLKPF